MTEPGLDDRDGHPPHRTRETASRYLPGVPVAEVVFPERPSGWHGWKARLRCRIGGGHYWHLRVSRPTPLRRRSRVVGTWTCCQCGASRSATRRAS